MRKDFAGKPEWLKVSLRKGGAYSRVKETVGANGLNTVCSEALCPNRGECWDSGTATFMILGDLCTRGCGFCAVSRGDPQGAVDRGEPRAVARAAREMGLGYAVVTSVTRDDLADGGASVFQTTVEQLKLLTTPPGVELLIPDFLGEPLQKVLEAGPDVVAHNVEVVRRLSGELRHGNFSYERSLRVLSEIASHGRAMSKSSLMLGVGETEEEVERTLHDLRAVGVSILALGQYLRPTARHAPVVEYVTPEAFASWGARAEKMGFKHVFSGPLVRTSYKAATVLAGRGVEGEL